MEVGNNNLAFKDILIWVNLISSSWWKCTFWTCGYSSINTLWSYTRTLNDNVLERIQWTFPAHHRDPFVLFFIFLLLYLKIHFSDPVTKPPKVNSLKSTSPKLVASVDSKKISIWGKFKKVIDFSSFNITIQRLPFQCICMRCCCCFILFVFCFGSMCDNENYIQV